jgi:hypothetical protein
MTFAFVISPSAEAQISAAAKERSQATRDIQRYRAGRTKRRDAQHADRNGQEPHEIESPAFDAVSFGRYLHGTDLGV